MVMVHRRRFVTRAGGIAFAAIVLGLLPAAAWAHVKWFGDANFGDRPRELSEVLTATFAALTALSMLVLSLLVWGESKLGAWAPAARVSAWLEQRAELSPLVVRVGLGVSLLLSWEADAVFAPELHALPLVGWLQFLLAALLLFERTTPLAGGGVLLLYLWALGRYGLLHVLDYVHFVGAGFYLLLQGVSRKRTQALRLPVLYATMGFSLCWLACEKLIYPGWALVLFERHPRLSMGLDPEFFLVGAAFVELNLGYLLIVGLLERPLSLAITLVFFGTTLVFGKLEVIGHTLIHAILIVFVLRGPGTIFKPPIRIHEQLPLRVLFASVNFGLLLALLLPLYAAAAEVRHEALVGRGAPGETGTLERLPAVADGAQVLQLEVERDSMSGLNLHLIVPRQFRFAPGAAGAAHRPGEGHAHLMVDGIQRARLYADWFHLPALEPGPHRVEVALYTNDHRPYGQGGRALSAAVEIDVADGAPAPAVAH